jgi:hypothetical protein
MALAVPKDVPKCLGFSPCSFCFQLFAISQRLKPGSKLATCGTTEVMPCYKTTSTTGYQGHFEIVEVILFAI